MTIKISDYIVVRRTHHPTEGTHTMGTEIDTYAATKLDPRYTEILGALRALMAEGAPDAAECLTYGSPAWRGRKVLAVISQSKTHLTFAFERGAEFEDRHGLLAGVGKKTRHVKIKTLEGVDEEALRDYITQAVRLDQS
ncbi:DUF1801 domain-containing protein [Actinomadura bangladeshensis]|uniref:DUF1801 domain-containing protein n=1 Tax=Actinomadura bangladeshensis TaxID=453573 RepID=A0A6L9QDK3_9ACTN|nr:DUF1801 domain-containing protein [Actinomadura bangladeshensis]NEA22294.1 DUF1801 domain-containing protein [Actinomadura bangladeshensis]